MGVTTYEREITSPLPAAKLFKAMVVDADVLLPKIMPQAFKNVQLLQGDGGPGTIKHVTFAEGSSFKYMKNKVEAIDKENLSFSHSVIESDVMGDLIEKISYDLKFEESNNGGCIIKEKSTYYTVNDAKLSEEEIKAGKEKAMAMFKAVESYLLSNPDA